MKFNLKESGNLIEVEINEKEISGILREITAEESYYDFLTENCKFNLNKQTIHSNAARDTDLDYKAEDEEDMDSITLFIEENLQKNTKYYEREAEALISAMVISGYIDISVDEESGRYKASNKQHDNIEGELKQSLDGNDYHYSRATFEQLKACADYCREEICLEVQNYLDQNCNL